MEVNEIRTIVFTKAHSINTLYKMQEFKLQRFTQIGIFKNLQHV